MKAGKITSLALLGALTLATVVVLSVASLIDGLQGMSAPAQVLITGAAAMVLFAAVLVPLGFALDTALARLVRYIGSASSNARTDPFGGPKLLQPITHAFIEAVDQFRQREQSLQKQLRDLEILHRVSEAERRQIEAVLHSLRDAVIVIDNFDEIAMVNEAAADIFGFEVADAIHKPVDEVIRDELLCQRLRDAREHANFRERRHVEHELMLGGAAGKGGTPPQATHFDVTLACVENHKHEVGGVVAVLHDLTRERELSQMKTEFVSKASHELRTPLSSIRAYVEMLVDGEADDAESRQEFYKIIYNETDRLGRLIDNMLNISRIEAGIIQIERESVDVKALVDRAIETIEPQAREKKISLHKKVAAVDLSVEGDADMLFQVVLNLLSNAVKYTPDGGRVTVSADSDNLTRSVLLTVSDTGLGIPADAIPKLFDKFFRVENYKRVAKGTGLGLSLCQHIVETLHHGQIGVESKVGMGSKFWVAVPMQYAGLQAA